jgi:hypothetical protein
MDVTVKGLPHEIEIYILSINAKIISFFGYQNYHLLLRFIFYLSSLELLQKEALLFVDGQTS